MQYKNKKRNKIILVMLVLFVLLNIAPTLTEAKQLSYNQIAILHERDPVLEDSPAIQGKCEPNPECPPELEKGGKGIRMQIPLPGVSKTCQTNQLEFTGNGKVECKEVNIYYAESFQQYISNFFNFFLGAIAVVSVVMIMVGGFIWMLAAGNSTRIGEAKSTIGGALGGLVLTLTAFTLFNTLNPDIVNLTLQDPNEVKPIIQGTQFCAALVDGTKVKDNNKEYTVINVNGNGFGQNPDLKCGFPFTFDARQADPRNSTIENCMGHYCSKPGSICIDKVGLGNQADFACLEGMIAGSITWDDAAWIDGGLQLWVACEAPVNTGTSIIKKKQAFELFEKDKKVTQTTRVYEISDQQISNGCERVSSIVSGSKGKEYSGVRAMLSSPNNNIKGLFLRIDVNDPGVTVGPASITPGIDDWYGLDRNCNLPLGGQGASDPANSEFDWSSVGQGNLITLIDLEDFFGDPATFRCDIKIQRRLFPDR